MENNSITNETKAKVFAQYLGQEIILADDCEEFTLDAVNINGAIFTDQCDSDGGYSIEDCKLLLKPLSSITDEDAIHITRLMYGNCNDFKIEIIDKRKCITSAKDEVRCFVNKGVFSLQEKDGDIFGLEKYLSYNIHVWQFLQSKGYDLPQHLLGGKTLYESGLCLYTNEITK